MSNFSNQFTGIISKINDSGSESQPRNLKVRELIYGQFDVDSTQPFASFKDRAFNWKYFAGEVAWYLKKDNDIEYINKFSNCKPISSISYYIAVNLIVCSHILNITRFKIIAE
jgi:thymidylate synthase